MAFLDLETGIGELFAEIQLAHQEHANRELCGPGYQVAVSAVAGRKRTRKPMTEAEKLMNRAYAFKWDQETVRRRILAGERPKFKQGPAPTRWLRVAAELGIDLYAPVQAQEAAQEAAAL